MDYLVKLKKNKTVVICSHRLNTLSLCDNIYVLYKGEIVEKGSHDELISNKDSIYYTFYI